MKTLALFLALAAINLVTQAQETEGITITVIVPNITSSDGVVLFGLYDENTFMKAPPIQSAKGEIVNGVATITFTNVSAGEYGISCVHDANNNKRMDFEENGMPKESYGVSNNAMSYGSPQWSDAKFTVDSENLALEIRL